MATKPSFRQTPTRTPLDVFLGKAEKPLGRLLFVKDGQREFSQFAYSDSWLADAQFFDVSPDLNAVVVPDGGGISRNGLIYKGSSGGLLNVG